MHRLPPGPRGRLATTYRILAQPFEYLPRWLREYGDPFTTPSINGTLVYTANPEGAREVFSADSNLFETFATDAFAPLIGPEALFLLSGPRHRRERKLLMPPFQGERMRAYARMMSEVAARHFARTPGRERFQVLDVAQDISMEIIFRAVFGVEDEHRSQEFTRAVLDMTNAMHPLFLFLPFLQREFRGHGPYARFRRKFRVLDDMLQDQITRLRARSEMGQDILSMMLAARYDDGTPMSDSNIRDQLRSLLLAGHETTTFTLSWCMDRIHRHPEVRTRLLQEIDALGTDPDPADYARCEYLDAVCKEVLRFYPVTPEVVRKLKQPFRLAGYEIPAGAALAPSILLIHRRPELYPEPERFRPERFLERSYSATEYLPFGGGHRRCIGAAFAMFELKIVLATALSRWRFETLEPTPPRPQRRTATIGPRGGVPMRAYARN